MSSFTNLAMQNRNAEEMKKKRKKEEMSDALLGGGGSGGSSDSSSEESSQDTSSSSQMSNLSDMAQAMNTSSSYNLGNLVADVAKDVVADAVMDKVMDKAGDVLEKAGKESLEKVGKKLLEEGAESGIKKAMGKVGGKLASYAGLAMCDGILPIGDAIALGLLAKDVADLLVKGLTGKTIGEHLIDGIDNLKEWSNDTFGTNFKDSETKKAEKEAKKAEEEAERAKRKAEADKALEEAEKRKKMAEAEKAKKEAEEKLKKEEEAKAKSQQSHQEGEQEEEEDDEDDEDDEIEDGSSSNTAMKKGLKKGLIHTAGTFGGSMAISLSMIGVYRTHYTGEFEYKGIGAEYQNQSIEGQNFTSYDENGDVILTGLSKENKLMKTFYTKYSDKSYYLIVEDSEKYSDINDAYKRKNLLTPDELREQYPDIEDVNNREAMFQLNPDVLYTLDKYIHQDTVLYPQQFVKPVYYEESKDDFALKDLVDEKGTIVAKSQTFDSNGKPVKNSDGTFKTTAGIWDYGFAPILRYQEHEVARRKVKNPVKRDVVSVSQGVEGASGHIVDSAPESGPIPGADTEISSMSNREKPAYIIDTAVTPGGTIVNKIEKQWIKDIESIENSRTTYTYSVKVGEVKKCKPIYQGNTGTGSGSNPPDLDAGSSSDNNLNNFTRETEQEAPESCEIVPIYDVYEVTDHYESYIEEELPQYVGEPSTENITGSKYFRDYMSSYSNYFPAKLPSKLDFRVLDNPEIQSLIYDDEPGNINSGQNQGALTGQTFKAEFTAYYPSNDPMQGGYLDAVGKPLDPSQNTCAAPWSSDYPKSLLTYGSKIQIQGTGTSKDGVVCTVNDKGSAIKLEEMPDGSLKYKIDILFPDKASANEFGRREGEIIIASDSSSGGTQTVSEVQVASVQERTPERLMNNYTAGQTRTASLILNTGGNAVTNYGMSIEDYTQKRASATGGCDSGNCNLSNFRENIEPMAFQEKVGDLRHLRLDTYRPVNEQVFISMFSSMFGKIGSYGAEMIEAGKQVNVDIVAKSAQLAEESGWGKHAIVGNYGGKTYYNFAGIGAYDGDAYNKGLQYAVKQGWDTPLKGMVGAVEWIAKNYIHNAEYKQNTYYKISMPTGVKHFYASNPDYAYNIANIMQNSIIKRYPDIYAPNAQFYFDFPEFDPNKPAGTIEGAGYVPGGGSGISAGGTPASAFNSYLATNWSGIESKWDELFPGQSELDASLDLVKKGDYTELYNNYEAKAKYDSTPGLKSKSTTVTTIPRSNNIYNSSMTEVDKQLTLNMMFALNQGNYLFKYDNMTEIEWKAMYTQLLSSPTGTTWDDKWVGFTKKDIFGIDDVGKLFKEDAGVSPVISTPYGMAKNSFSEDTSKLTQYNFVNFGIDIVVPPETEVLTVADGEVISVNKKNDINSRYGNYVEIKHANGTQTLTANLKDVNVKVGQKLSKGDVIGTSGGDSKAYKDNALHYQIRHKGQLINPTWIITGEMTGFEDPILGNNGVYCGGSVVTEVSNNAVVNKAIAIAKQQIGKPYVWGATGPNSFDCSGFMYYIMKEAGVPGGRKTAIGYYKESTEIPRDQIQPGDFVFWHDLTGSKHSPVYHIGVYMGNDEVIDSSTDHKGVGLRKFSSLQDSSKRRFTVGRYAPFAGSSSGVISGGVSGSGCQTSTQISQSAELTWPVSGSSEVSSDFGWRVVNGVKDYHEGIDIVDTPDLGKGAVGPANDIVASQSGKVTAVENSCPAQGSYGSSCGGGYGNYVKIEGTDGNEYVYAHLYPGSVPVKVNDTVEKGQVLGKMGTSGSSTGIHLHFGIKKDGKWVDPLNGYLNRPA